MFTKGWRFEPGSLSHALHRFIWSLWVCGAAATVAGFLGAFAPELAVLLVVPLAALALLGTAIAARFSRLATLERHLLYVLSATWALHLLQVFVPESGFDALWYHLPVAEVVLDNQRFIYDPGLYQSLNPLFADAVFFLGFAWQRELGAKVVAYLFGLALVAISYVLARRQLPRAWSLVTVLVVSAFQVVAWQSSSFYIDLAKAAWELAAVVYLLEYLKERGGVERPAKAGRWLLASGLMLGASLASKAFSVVLLPVFAGMLLWSRLSSVRIRSFAQVQAQARVQAQALLCPAPNLLHS
jgi:hypothetical protein